MTDQDLRELTDRVFAAGRVPLRRYQRGARALRVEGMVLSSSDLPGPIFNTAAVLGESPSPERALALAAEFFRDRPNGWGVLLPGDVGHPLEAELRARGWRAVNDLPAMAMAAIPPAPRPPLGLAIGAVCDRATLADYYVASRGEAAGEGYRDDGHGPAQMAAGLVPHNATEVLYPSVACALDEEVGLFVGYAEGRPVASAALFCIEGIAEIGNVNVHASYRRRGFGTAITWAALAEGRARGCQAAVLATTPLGYPIYLQMGFVPVGMYRRYAFAITEGTLG